MWRASLRPSKSSVVQDARATVPFSGASPRVRGAHVASLAHRDARSDDGFAMGVAYVLSLLNLEHEFMSLHWFDSVQAHYRKLLREARQDAAATGNGKQERRAAQLRAQQIEATMREYELLRFSFSSSRVFFADAQVEVPPAADAAKKTDDAGPAADASAPDASASGANTGAPAPAAGDGDAPVVASAAPPPPPPPPPPPKK